MIAEGHYDLRLGYVEQVPIPDLVRMFREDTEREAILALSQLGSEPQVDEWQWQGDVDDATRNVYGGVVDDVGE